MIGDDPYVLTESGFDLFFNEYVPDSREEVYKGLIEKGHKYPYQGNDLPDIDDFSMDTNDRDNEEIFDSYLGEEILLPDQDRNKKMAKAIKGVKGNDGNPMRTRHNKPMLDTSE